MLKANAHHVKWGDGKGIDEGAGTGAEHALESRDLKVYVVVVVAVAAAADAVVDVDVDGVGTAAVGAVVAVSAAVGAVVVVFAAADFAI